MPKIDDNGVIREMTAAEIAEAESAVIAHFASMPYGDAVDAEIRKRYSVSQEFAILRQKDAKPDEYTEYYAYCEECKARVKEMIGGEPK